MLETNHCYCMDCMEGMAQFQDSCFDLAVVDPPYFSGPERRHYYGSNVSRTRVRRNYYPVSAAWKVPGKAYFDELRRVSKHYIIWAAIISAMILRPAGLCGTNATKARVSRIARLPPPTCLPACVCFGICGAVCCRGKALRRGIFSKGIRHSMRCVFTRHKSRLRCMTGCFSVMRRRVCACWIPI